MNRQKAAKFILMATTAILLVSNIITVRALLLHKNAPAPEQVENTAESTYRAAFFEVLKENQELKERIAELEGPAKKWGLYQQRYGNSSRGGDNRKEEGVVSSKEPIRMRVTAYTEYECNKDPDHPEFRITTSGNEVEEWFTAAAGPELPFGTRIYIPYFRDYENHGIFVVEDRGGAIKENCIDIYIPDQETVDNFGVKWLDVYILDD